MANKILHKRSSTPSSVPAPGELDYGELAMNYADGKLFMKKADNSVVEVGGGNFVPTAGGSMTGALDVTVSGTDQVVAEFLGDLGTNNGRGLRVKTPASDSATEPVRLTSGNDIAFEIDGSQVFKLDSSAVLWVGQDGIGDSQIQFYDDNSDDWRRLKWDDSSNEFRIEDNSGTMRTIIHGGNIDSYVGSGSASLPLGAIGTYAMLHKPSGGDVAPGNTAAGSALRYSNVDNDQDGTPSGTWRAMGTIDTATTDQSTTVWLRIS